MHVITSYQTMNWQSFESLVLLLYLTISHLTYSTWLQYRGNSNIVWDLQKGDYHAGKMDGVGVTIAYWSVQLHSLSFVLGDLPLAAGICIDKNVFHTLSTLPRYLFDVLQIVVNYGGRSQ